MPRLRLNPSGCAEPLLCFQEVTKRYGCSAREVLVLDRVSFELAPGGSAGLYGAKRAGKSTILRLAAALERPDGGAVHVAGRDVAGVSMRERARLLRTSVALLSGGDSITSPGETVLDYVSTSLGARGLTLRQARRVALGVLDEVGLAGVCVAELTAALPWDQLARVALARAIARDPLLLLVDEPAPMPSVRDRDRFCALLRRLAHERGMALVVASEDMSALQGLDVLMSISGAELCSTQRRARIVELHSRRAAMPGRS